MPARKRTAAKRTAAKRTATKRTNAKPTAAKPSTPKKGLSMREAALAVFRGNRNAPLKLKDLYAAMCKRTDYAPSKAATPTATLAAMMYTRPEQFEKVDTGTFRANPDYLRSSR
jgi:hypothetical protein